jgi:hypothetical protein
MIGNYITCEHGHKMFIVWVDERKRFAFTCDECEIITPVAQTIQGVIEIKLHEGALLGRKLS